MRLSLATLFVTAGLIAGCSDESDASKNTNADRGPANVTAPQGGRGDPTTAPNGTSGGGGSSVTGQGAHGTAP